MVEEKQKQPAPGIPERRVFLMTFIIANHTIIDTSHHLELFPYQLRGNPDSKIYLPAIPRV